tara:strand:+ start:401 stop:523 length:123 start_codon:yes stop_codon:yes gene_type:complete
MTETAEKPKTKKTKKVEPVVVKKTPGKLSDKATRGTLDKR